MVVIYKQVPSKLTERRIDPWHYQPSFEKQINKIAKNLGNLSLESVIDSEHGVSSGATPLGANYLEKGRVRFYRTSEVEDMFLVSEEAVYITDEDDEKLKRSRLIEGDVLLTITGAKFGKSAVVGADHLPGNISQHSVRFKPKSEKIDAHFLVAYLNCNTGQIAIWREAYGATRPAIDFPSIRALIIPKVALDAQKYIGNKVRQAEKLRDWGKCGQENVEQQFISKLGAYSRTNSLTQKVSTNFLTDRLDQNHYQNHLLENHKILTSSKFVQLGDSSIFSNLTDGDHGNPVYGNGPIYLRASEIDNGQVLNNKVVKLSIDYAKKVGPSCWAKEGDVIFSIVGTLGMTAVIEHNQEGVMSRGIAKISSNKLPSYYLKAFFKTDYFGDQLIRHSVGTIQRGVYIHALEKLIVPVFDEDLMSDIAQSEFIADQAITLSKNLTETSKTLVEALIEGQLTEEQLIQAQQALEDGDNTLDKAILSKISSEGYAVEGATPLFSDVDELYRLLASATAADSED